MAKVDRDLFDTLRANGLRKKAAATLADAYSKADGGMVVADLWDSAEAFGKFAEEQIGPAGAAVGLGPIEPRIVPVHNRIRGRARVS